MSVSNSQIAPFISLIVILLLWQGITMLELYPAFIIPPPLAVLSKFQGVLADGSLWLHTRTTLWAVIVGLGVGLSIGVVLGYLIAKSRLLESLLSPLIVAFQSVPVVAYAPLLVIWFGSGPTSKIVTSALIVFFPMLLNTIVGIRNVPLSLRDLMRSMQATPWQTFTKLEVPAAMPILIGGLKISATLAVIGAVVGEFVNANAGLGFLINLARSQYDTPLVIVAVLTLTLIARLLYTGVSVLEARLLAWQLRVRRN
jgi:NitT/TauT family transport system permease protein